MKDLFGREITYLRLSVTDLCNLRCRYCMSGTGVRKKLHEDMLTEDEMINAVRAAACLGITKLRLTGGEPLIKKNILSICQRAAETPGIREVCLTTNGILLPDLANELFKAGVSRLNISLDTLRAEKYTYITRLGQLNDVFRGIEAAYKAGFRKLKINVVLIGGFNDNEIRDFAHLTIDYDLEIRFIELMPMAGNKEFGRNAYVPSSKVLEELPELLPLPTDSINSNINITDKSNVNNMNYHITDKDKTTDNITAGSDEPGVAKLYKLPGAKGRIGLISPVYQHFCDTCNRIRLTADGFLKPCLHYATEISIKGLTMEEMKYAFRKAILEKPERHGTLSYNSRSTAGRTMNEIGG